MVQIEAYRTDAVTVKFYIFPGDPNSLIRPVVAISATSFIEQLDRRKTSMALWFESTPVCFPTRRNARSKTFPVENFSGLPSQAGLTE